jgi:hypothetical protein
MSANVHTLPTTSPNVAHAARIGVVAAGTALVANLAALGVATLAGATMLVRQGAGQPAMRISIALVVVTTLVPVLAGTLLLIPARGWGARGWRAVAAVGLALGLLSVALPLSTQASPGTHLALVSMHVIAGVTWFVVVRGAATRFWGV